MRPPGAGLCRGWRPIRLLDGRSLVFQWMGAQRRLSKGATTRSKGCRRRVKRVICGSRAIPSCQRYYSHIRFGRLPCMDSALPEGGAGPRDQVFESSNQSLQERSKSNSCIAFPELISRLKKHPMGPMQRYWAFVASIEKMAGGRGRTLATA